MKRILVLFAVLIAAAIAYACWVDPCRPKRASILRFLPLSEEKRLTIRRELDKIEQELASRAGPALLGGQSSSIVDLLAKAYKWGPFIYGPDDRWDPSWHFFMRRRTRRNVDSTAVLLFDRDIEQTSDKKAWRITRKRTLLDDGVCEDERFTKQLNIGQCSGFLIAPDLLVTASHCVRADELLGNYKIVFGYKTNLFGRLPAVFPNEDVVAPDDIVFRSNPTNQGPDLLIIRLAKSVTHRRYLMLTDKPAKKNDKVYVIGYPLGLPAKYADNAFVRAEPTDVFFESNLDSYHVSSGSPVFNARSDRLEGILVRGEIDFVTLCGCLRSTACPNTGCMGEHVTRTSELQKLFVKPVQAARAER